MYVRGISRGTSWTCLLARLEALEGRPWRTKADDQLTGLLTSRHCGADDARTAQSHAKAPTLSARSRALLQLAACTNEIGDEQPAWVFGHQFTGKGFLDGVCGYKTSRAVL